MRRRDSRLFFWKEAVLIRTLLYDAQWVVGRTVGSDQVRQNPSDSDHLFRNQPNNILDQRLGLFAKLTAGGLATHWAISTAGQCLRRPCRNFLPV